jgi:Zonular occludens toxin (Zot)
VIRLVTGPLGTGKSYYGVRKAAQAMREGKLVCTNFSMVDGWVDQVVRHGRLRKNSRKLDERSERFAKRYWRVSTMQELMQVRVRPEPPWAREIEDGKWQLKEGSLVVLLDEAHRWMNARSWSKEGREELLDFFALARKRGMHVYLIAQRAENLDVQVRELFEDHIKLNNLRRSARMMGIPVIPFNFFIAGWRNHAYPNEVIKTERYRLGWEKRLYDTMDTVSFTEGAKEEGGLLLPFRDDEQRGEGTEAADAAPAAAAPDPPPVSGGPVGAEADPGERPTVPDPALGG